MGGRGTSGPSSSWGRHFESFSAGDRPYGEAERREFENWAEALPARTADIQSRKPNIRARYAYQIRVAGDREYLVSGGGRQVWADGIDPASGRLVEAKYVIEPPRSPFIEGSACPEYVRDPVKRELDGQFFRYATVIADPTVPARGLEVRVSDARAAPYFEGLMREHGVPGRVTVLE